VGLHLIPSHELDYCPHTRSDMATAARPGLTAQRLQRLDADHLQVLAGARVQGPATQSVVGIATVASLQGAHHQPPRRYCLRPPAACRVSTVLACKGLLWPA